MMGGRVIRRIINGGGRGLWSEMGVDWEERRAEKEFEKEWKRNNRREGESDSAWRRRRCRNEKGISCKECKNRSGRCKFESGSGSAEKERKERKEGESWYAWRRRYCRGLLEISCKECGGGKECGVGKVEGDLDWWDWNEDEDE